MENKITTELLEQKEVLENSLNIMDVASTDMTPEQEEQISNLANAKIANIVGAGNPLEMINLRKRKPLKREYNIGRNEKCPCGSGKKYKHCCLKTGEYEQLI